MLPESDALTVLPRDPATERDNPGIRAALRSSLDQLKQISPWLGFAGLQLAQDSLAEAMADIKRHLESLPPVPPSPRIPEAPLHREALALSDYMSDLSEDTYCAGWMSGLEFALWGFVLNGPGKYGMGEITQANIDDLKYLSELAGGWVHWTGNKGVPGFRGGLEFVLFDEWESLVAERGKK